MLPLLPTVLCLILCDSLIRGETKAKLGERAVLIRKVGGR